MKHKKNKLRLNEIQGFYFLFKFGLVLTYILMVYCKKSSSIFLKKDMFNSLHFSFEKQKPSQVLKDFSVENLETTPSTFFSKFSSDIYLELLIIGGSIFALYLTSGAFFFLFLSVFSLTDFKNSKDSRELRGNHYFSFLLPLTHEY